MGKELDYYKVGKTARIVTDFYNSEEYETFNVEDEAADKTAKTLANAIAGMTMVMISLQDEDDARIKNFKAGYIDGYEEDKEE